MAYTFNHDLLLGDADLEQAKQDFPNVAFALSNPALNEVFRPIDRRAIADKTRSRRWGVAAVALATFSLMLAAAEVLYHGAHKDIIRLVAAIGAIAGIASVLIGVFGVMYRDRKLQWLADRLSTERIRQFHFQTYAAYAGEIIDGAGNEDAEQAFLARRADEFAAFKASVIDRAREELCTVVEAEDPGEGLFFPERESPIDPASPHLAEYFRAYTVLRFNRQIGYCDHMLRENAGLWKHAPIRQSKIIGAVAMFCVFAILALHALVFTGALADIRWMKGPEIHVLAIWSAILALAARTIEEGFQPETEIERLRQYRLSLKRIFHRFNRASDPRDKFRAMLDLEKLSFEEMVLFLRSNHEAKFVM